MIIEGLQLWNKATNADYKKLMEGAKTTEEKDERIQDAVDTRCTGMNVKV